MLFKLSRAIMKARNGIDVVHLGTHQKKNPGAATPGFLCADRVYKYLSSLAKKSQEIFKFFIKIKKGALNKPCCFLYFNRC